MREDARVLKTWRKINCWAQIITRRSKYGFWWFVLNNWFFFKFLTPAHPHAQSLFLFPIVFGINSILCVRYARWERERERERYRERERDRRKWRHHCRAKFGDEFTLSHAKNSHNCCEFTLSLAKKSHFSFLPSHFLSHNCGAEIRSSHFPLPKIRPLCSDWMARAARRVIENPRQTIKFCPVLLFFPSKKWIKLIPKTIGNRKRDCAWGGSGW